MAETSPFNPEEEIENNIEEELLVLLLTAFVNTGKKFSGDTFTFDLVNDSNSQLTKDLSKIMPVLSSSASETITVGLDRAMRETDLTDLSYNFGSQRLQDTLTDIFQKHIGFITETNVNAVQRLLTIAAERGWSDREILRRLNRYWGLIPDHINTVVKLEDALTREGATRTVINRTVQKKIDQLLEWRSSLTAAQVATEVTEHSKATAFAEMFEDGDLPADYVKQAVAVLDENTTVICTTSHLTVAELNGNFPNGFFAPPFNNPIHPCRTSLRIIKRPQEF